MYAPEKFSSEEAEYRKKHKNQIPLEQKKTYEWIKEIRKIREIAKNTPNTVHIYAADREADNFDIFQELNYEENKIHYVIRASVPRGIEGTEKTSFDFIRSTNKLGTAEIVIPRDNEGREERISEFGIYAHNVTIKAPRHRRNNPSINTNIVRIIEETLLDGEDPIEWILYTSLTIDNLENIINIVGIYRKRWRIEKWHRVIKTACNAERLTLRTFERLCRALAIKMIVTWRIMLLTLLGREHPELPPEVAFTKLEVKLLSSYAKSLNQQIPKNLEEATKQVAKMGGFLDHGKDAKAGNQTFARGLEKLQTCVIVASWILESVIEDLTNLTKFHLSDTDGIINSITHIIEKYKDFMT